MDPGWMAAAGERCACTYRTAIGPCLGGARGSRRGPSDPGPSTAREEPSRRRRRAAGGPAEAASCRWRWAGGARTWRVAVWRRSGANDRRRAPLAAGGPSVGKRRGASNVRTTARSRATAIRRHAGRDFAALSGAASHAGRLAARPAGQGVWINAQRGLALGGRLELPLAGEGLRRVVMAARDRRSS